MARLSDDTITRIKTEISLLRLVESQGHQPKKQGKDWALCCPFHQGDDTPSLLISPHSNLFHCFGCGAAGSVIDWVMQTQQVAFRRACEILQPDAGLLAGESPPAQPAPPSPLRFIAAAADQQTALREVIDYYHQTLKQAPEALAYLASRGLNHAELIDTFKLGYANRTLGHRLPEKNRKAGAELRGQLQEIGILRESGHEHFNGSLVVPIIDGNGRITEVYGRKILNHLRPGTAYHLYLPGPHQGVWNVAALQAHQEIILCEALLDAMSFWVNGYRNVTASYGTSGFTEDHLAAFKQYDITRVLIAYDRDEAGNTAAAKLARRLHDHGIDTGRILFPSGLDANDYALQMTPAATHLGRLIRQAQAGEPPQPPPALAAVLTEAATVLPAAEAAPSGVAPVNGEISLTLGDRHYRIRGLHKNLSSEQLKVNLRVMRGEQLHLDSLDLYQARPRQHFIQQASTELGVADEVIKRDLGQLLLKLEALQPPPGQPTREPQQEAPVLNEVERQQALALLQSPNLLQRILDDFQSVGVVGEETNKRVGYLACLSRKLDKPLAVMIQSSSAAGKSSLMEAILNFIPEEERVQYSAMTGQSLFYMGETNLKHKILAIAEAEGAENASYALKLLQSEGELTIASTGKDDSTGNLITKEYRVEGPVMLFLTTTAIDIDEELMNRCLVLTVNEGRQQTQAIHALQRQQQTLQGLLQNEDRKQLIRLHRNAQRLLRPLLVANPFAEKLTFLDDKTRTRRDHLKYLTLMRAIALLHQYQREVKTVNHQGQVLSFVEVTKADIEIANQLAHVVLGRSLDELPPQTRALLKQVHQMVIQHCGSQGIEQQDYRFSRREVRDFTGWGNTQLKLHLKRLEEMEYLLVHRGGRGLALVYELLYRGEGEHGEHFLPGLIDPEQLGYDAQWSAQEAKKSAKNGDWAEPSRGQVGVKSGPSRAVKNAAKPVATLDSSEKCEILPKTHIRAVLPESHPHRNPGIPRQEPGFAALAALTTMVEG